jgi:plasmid stability protein
MRNYLDVVSICNYNITMKNITIRNIPTSVFEKLRLLSELDRRSLNNEMLIAIESGVKELEQQHPRSALGISSAVQLALWKGLSGKWKDKKTKEAQIKELFADRTMGREVSW